MAYVKVEKEKDKETELPPTPQNAIHSKEIRLELFRQLGRKPDGFKSIEIKTICPSHSYRVNLVCQKDDDGIVRSLYRPLSYYVVSVADGFVFNPEIVPIST